MKFLTVKIADPVNIERVVDRDCPADVPKFCLYRVSSSNIYIEPTQ